MNRKSQRATLGREFLFILAIALVACLVSWLVSGCGTSAPAGSSAPVKPTASASAVTPAATPTPAATLTIQQAAAEYVKLADPLNRLSSAVSNDYTDARPISQYAADSLAYARAMGTFDTDLLAVQWPASVEPWVRAMVATEDANSITCAEAEAASGSYSAATAVSNTNTSCKASSYSQPDPDANEIRSLLGLPAVTN